MAGSYLKSFLFALILILSNSAVYSQESIDGFSINPKASFYNKFAEDGGLVAGVELGVRKGKLLYSIDYLAFEEFSLFNSANNSNYNQLGCMIGSYLGDEYVRLQYQVGFNSLWGRERDELIHCGPGLFGPCNYSFNYFSTIGLQLKLGLKLVPSRYFSLGIDLQTNINSVKILYTPLFSLEFGILRKKIE